MKRISLKFSYKTFQQLMLTAVVAFNVTSNASAEHKPIATGLQPEIRIEGHPTVLSSLKERMAHHRVPGVSIAFMKNHEIIWTHTEGVKDAKTQTPIDANTVFQSASISKPVFATILMLYKQKHGLDLDTDVNSLLKSWSLPKHEWETTSPVTLRRLLSHSAGTTVHGFAGYSAGESVPNIVEVLSGSKPANSKPIIVDIEPGTQFRYSGGGTTLAQLVLQDVSGVALPHMAADAIFIPLGMNHSAFAQPLSGRLTQNAAVAHNMAGKPVEGGAHTYATLAAAGLWTTPSDLLRFSSVLQRAYHGEDESLLTQESAREILTVQHGPVGLGFFLEGKDDTFAFSHSGSNKGFRAYLYVHANTGDGIAIMTNGDGGNALMGEILMRIGELYSWSEMKPVIKNVIKMTDEQLAGFTGTYHTPYDPNIRITVTRKDGILIVNAGDRILNAVFHPESNNQFFSQNGEGIEFKVSEDGAIEEFTYNGFLKAVKVK